MAVRNQLNPPLPKKKRVDSLGNSRNRMFFKSGNATMLFCKGLTENGCKVLEQHIIDVIEGLGSTLEGKFIITQ